MYFLYWKSGLRERYSNKNGFASAKPFLELNKSFLFCNTPRVIFNTLGVFFISPRLFPNNPALFDHLLSVDDVKTVRQFVYVGGLNFLTLHVEDVR